MVRLLLAWTIDVPKRFWSDDPDALERALEVQVALTNLALLDSGTHTRLELVGPRPELEGDWRFPLDELKQSEEHWGEGWRALASARTKASADLVGVVVGDCQGLSPGKSGEAIVFTCDDDSPDRNGYFLLEGSSPAAASMSLAHEVGHCFGCGHSGADALRCYDDSLGSLSPVSTILSGGGDLHALFSSGAPEGHDNAATIRRNAPKVARFR